MIFKEPIEEGIFLRRYKRFFADIEWRGQTITAHVPNTGSLKSCLESGSPCRISRAANPKRKLAWTLQMVKTPKSWVGVNTLLANDLVWEGWQKGLVSHWQDYREPQREFKLNPQTRIDLVLWKDQAKSKGHFVEVKNVTLKHHDQAQFPDAVTTRGQKHLRELMSLLDQGHSSEILFVIQREDCDSFAPADAIDPEYGQLLRQANEKGVRVTAMSTRLTEQGIELKTEVPLLFTCRREQGPERHQSQ